jgi:hypothetical protein
MSLQLHSPDELVSLGILSMTSVLIQLKEHLGSALGHLGIDDVAHVALHELCLIL